MCKEYVQGALQDACNGHGNVLIGKREAALQINRILQEMIPPDMQMRILNYRYKRFPFTVMLQELIQIETAKKLGIDIAVKEKLDQHLNKDAQFELLVNVLKILSYDRPLILNALKTTLKEKDIDQLTKEIENDRLVIFIGDKEKCFRLKPFITIINKGISKIIVVIMLVAALITIYKYTQFHIFPSKMITRSVGTYFNQIIASLSSEVSIVLNDVGTEKGTIIIKNGNKLLSKLRKPLSGSIINTLNWISLSRDTFFLEGGKQETIDVMVQTNSFHVQSNFLTDTIKIRISEKVVPIPVSLATSKLSINPDMLILKNKNHQKLAFIKDGNLSLELSIEESRKRLELSPQSFSLESAGEQKQVDVKVNPNNIRPGKGKIEVSLLSIDNRKLETPEPLGQIQFDIKMDVKFFAIDFGILDPEEYTFQLEGRENFAELAFDQNRVKVFMVVCSINQSRGKIVVFRNAVRRASSRSIQLSRNPEKALENEHIQLYQLLRQRN